jgi:hypothetical protein
MGRVLPVYARIAQNWVMAKVTDCDKGKATTVVRGENETLWN